MRKLSKHNIKLSFSLLELIFSIILLTYLVTLFIPKDNTTKLNLAADKIVLYLKYTRYIAMIDDKYNINDPLWFRERYTLKFQNCSKKVGGLYFIVYSDTNHKGSPNKSECLKDPITNKYLYSHYDCEASYDESKHILLTKEFNIVDVDISCNETTTLGQVSFDKSGEVYSKLGTSENDINKYKIKEKCNIRIYDINKNSINITIEPETGYIEKRTINL